MLKHVIVIGAGVVGLSAARAALKAGFRVTLLEQGTVPNPQSASHDQHRLIRYQYGKAAGYTTMVRHAFGAWQRLWDDLGICLFERTGALGLSHAPTDYVADTLKTFQDLRIPHERLNSTEIERLAPQLSVPEGTWGLLNEDGGVLLADRIVTALADWVRNAGADVRANTRVADIDMYRALVSIEDGSVLQADTVLVAAGAWLGELLPEYARPTYRQAVCYVDVPDDIMHQWRSGLCLTDIGIGDNYALMPVRDTGLKFGSGAHRKAGSPALGFSADPDEGYQVIAPFLPFLRHADLYRPRRMAVGYYVKDSSEAFQTDVVGKTLVITNCDGQMFKFGPLMGEKLIACVQGALSPADLKLWAAGGWPASE